MDTVVAGTPDVARRDERFQERSRAVSAELRRMARKARTPRPKVSGGGGFRARRGDRVFRFAIIGSFVLLFAIPISTLAMYLWLVASDQYVSEVRFSVRAGEASGIASVAGLSGLIDTGQTRDGLMISQFVESRSLVERLDRRFDLRSMFRVRGLDYYSSVRPNAPIEKLVKYWKGQTDIAVDRNGLVTLKVRAFTPDDSLALTREIIASSEDMVNQLTRRAERDAVKQAEVELERVKTRLQEATAALRDARDHAGVLDIDVAAKGYADVVTALRLELTKVDQSIDGLKRMTSDAPQLVALQSRAQSLRKQIREYDRAIAGEGTVAGGDPNLATRAVALQMAELTLKVARSEYASATAVFEQARLTSERQRSYILTYVEPRLAEEALYPRRTVTWLILATACLICWALVAGGALLVRDHMAS